jgi:hypothetical protein
MIGTVPGPTPCRRGCPERGSRRQSFPGQNDRRACFRSRRGSHSRDRARHWSAPGPCRIHESRRSTRRRASAAPSARRDAVRPAGDRRIARRLQRNIPARSRRPRRASLAGRTGQMRDVG